MNRTGRRPEDELSQHWRILLVAFVGLMMSAATLPTYAIGTFVIPLQAEFGWTRSEIQASVFFAQGGCALCGLFVGSLLSKIGVRKLVISGILGVSVSFFALAILPLTLPIFYLGFAGVAAFGCGTIPVVWCHLMTGTFAKRRGLALAIALTGTGIAGIFVPFLLASVIEQLGWRMGFVMLAALPVLIAMPLAVIWLSNSAEGATVDVKGPSDNGTGYRFSEAIRSYRFYILCLSVVLIYLSITGILTNIIPAMTSRGMSAGNAAIVQSGYAISLIFGRLGIGWLVDRYWGPGVAALAITPAAFGAVLLVGSADFPQALLGIALVGIAAGAELDLLAYLTSRYFGLRHFSHIYSVLYACVATAGASGPMVFARIQEWTSSYDNGFYLAAGALAIGGIMIMFLGRYPERFPNNISTS